jgi:hypothetical protein
MRVEGKARATRRLAFTGSSFFSCAMMRNDAQFTSKTSWHSLVFLSGILSRQTLKPVNRGQEGADNLELTNSRKNVHTAPFLSCLSGHPVQFWFD